MEKPLLEEEVELVWRMGRKEEEEEEVLEWEGPPAHSGRHPSPAGKRFPARSPACPAPEGQEPEGHRPLLSRSEP